MKSRLESGKARNETQICLSLEVSTPSSPAPRSEGVRSHGIHTSELLNVVEEGPRCRFRTAPHSSRTESCELSLVFNLRYEFSGQKKAMYSNAERTFAHLEGAC